MFIAIIVISAVVAISLLTFFINKLVHWLASAPVDENGVKTKRGLKDVKEWFINHKPSKRRLIQVYAALLYNANIKGFITGNIYQSETTKYMCVPGLNCYSCPGAVGACPLGSLQNALAESNTRAPYYILGILALFGLMCARTICGFLCPVGLCQELLYKVRTPKLKKSRVTRVLSYFKYVLLALLIAIPLTYATFNIPLPAFCKYICPAGTFEGAVLLLSNPSNTNLFAQLGWQFTFKLSLLVIFIVASMFIFRAFCRFICPLGAIYGFFNRFALIGVCVDKNSCTECGLCVSYCKMDIKHVGDHECINCGECMPVCPTKAISWKGSSIFLRGKKIDAGGEIAVFKPIAVGVGVATIAPEVAAVPQQDEGQGNQTYAISETAVTSEGDSARAVESEESAKEVVTQDSAPTVKRKKRSTKFWAEVVTWIVALAVLVTALVMYNFVDIEKAFVPDTPITGGDVETGNQVGDIAPDFTVELYGSEGSFNLYENRGKITVINFWATWCTPCVNELPFFNELAVNHPELDVIAIHGASTTNVANFITSKGWDDYSVTFAQDNLNGTKCLTFAMLGGTDKWPMTVIVDAEGKIIYNDILSFHSYEDLNTLVTGLIANN